MASRSGPAKTQPPVPHVVPVGPAHEPVWLVRIVVVLFLIGFAAFLAREVANFVRTV